MAFQVFVEISVTVAVTLLGILLAANLALMAGRISGNHQLVETILKHAEPFARVFRIGVSR